MPNARLIQIASVLVAGLCLFGATMISGRVVDVRQEYGLGPDRQFNEKVPPAVTFASAVLGPWRGLGADAMWFRAEKLKEEGKYHEALKLSETITMFQARFPKVWSFMAWNMAYNISVKTSTPEERWDWVNKGINLLRERGIPLNPKAVALYRELSWIFSHKVGQRSDDMHWYYKAALAHEMQEVLGSPADGATGEQVIDRFRLIVNAPRTLEQLLATDAKIAVVLEKMAALNNAYEPDERMLRAIGRISMFISSRDARNFRFDPNKVIEAFDPDLVQVVRNPEYEPQIRALLAYLRRKVLVEHYRMDPSVMLDLMEKDASDPDDIGFGPMDWRHPAAHSAYWGYLGVEMARKVYKGQKEIDLINTDRQVIHSLQALRDTGNIVYDPVTRKIDMLPDPRYIEAYETAMLAAVERMKASGTVRGSVLSTFDSGHENFLSLAIAYEFVYGREEKAKEYRSRARKMYGHLPHNQTPKGYKYDQPLEELVADWYRENGGMIGSARQFIDAMITRAFLHGLGNNKPDVYNRMMKLAQHAYKQKMKDVAADARIEQDRMALPAFGQMVLNSFGNLVLDPRRPLLTRQRVWINGPLVVRQRVYDQLLPKLAAQVAVSNIDVNVAFPEPAGMEAFRKANPRVIEPRDSTGEGTVKIQ